MRAASYLVPAWGWEPGHCGRCLEHRTALRDCPDGTLTLIVADHECFPYPLDEMP